MAHIVMRRISQRQTSKDNTFEININISTTTNYRFFYYYHNYDKKLLKRLAVEELTRDDCCGTAGTGATKPDNGERIPGAGPFRGQ